MLKRKKGAKIKRLLLRIEELAGMGETIEDYPGQIEIKEIYRLTHSFNHPRCNKNHPDWKKKLDNV